jgi:hypothetical protein
VEKSKKGEFYLKLFDSFSKIAIVSDKLPPSNIVQKGIKITMKKMNDPNPEKQDPTTKDFEEIRNQSYITRLTSALTVKEAANRLKSLEIGLSGRDFEVWKPVLTIASIIGDKCWENVLNYAKESRAEIVEESYEELKEVLEAIYQIIKDLQGRFPITFTPKQIHDKIWDKCKDDYKIMKDKQEREGEVTEKYDYDTKSFERWYNTRKIGRTYLNQLCIKKKMHTEKGTQYKLQSEDEFNELIDRFHPQFIKQINSKKIRDNQNISEMSNISSNNKMNINLELKSELYDSINSRSSGSTLDKFFFSQSADKTDKYEISK